MNRLIRSFIGWLIAPLGIIAYHAIKKSDCFDIIICDHIGDFLYTIGYLEEFRKINGISKLRIISTKRLKCISEFYPKALNDYKTVGRRHLQLMMLPYRYRLWRLMLYRQENIKIIEPARDFVAQYDYVKSFPNLTLKDCIKYGILNLPLDSAMSKPYYYKQNKTKCENISILLCPFANLTQWKDCSELFKMLESLSKDNKYSIAINSEDIPLNIFAETASQTDIIIGVRSGILDFAALLGCTVIAVYPRGDRMMQYFDLGKMSENENKTFQYELTNNIDDDIKNILSLVHKGRNQI